MPRPLSDASDIAVGPRREAVSTAAFRHAIVAIPADTGGLAEVEESRNMQERKTISMLQRVPVILAVTAASYGLQLPPSVAGRAAGQGVSTKVATTQPLIAAPRTDGKRIA
jgi:hypothetical protein